jgi:hypothetical protein
VNRWMDGMRVCVCDVGTEQNRMRKCGRERGKEGKKKERRGGRKSGR